MRRYAGVALLALAVAAVHVHDAATRQRMLQQYLRAKAEAVPEIAARYGPRLEGCGYEPASELHALSRALLTVETLATPELEARLREGVLRASLALGMEPPNISVGPGRLKLRTALSGVRASTSEDVERYRGLSPAALARRLLSTCDAFRLATAVVGSLLPCGAARPLGLEDIRTAVRRYSGAAAAPASAEAGLSAAVYFELTYAAYQHYRFEALRAAAPAEPSVPRPAPQRGVPHPPVPPACPQLAG